MDYSKTKKFWEKADKKVHSDISEDVFLFYYNKINEYLNFSKNDNVLDIGCGDGSVDKYVKNIVSSLAGFDFSSNLIKKALLKNPEVNYWEQSFLDEYKTKGFDKAFSFSAMFYCKPADIYLFIDKSVDCLNANGIVGHFDVPDVKKMGKYYLKQKGSINKIKGIINYFRFRISYGLGIHINIWKNDGSYWQYFNKIENYCISRGYKYKIIDSHSPYRNHILIFKNDQ
jgi:cyclopropane fatty-acyl-phospholipid synthase-like methyltransferase